MSSILAAGPPQTRPPTPCPRCGTDGPWRVRLVTRTNRLAEYTACRHQVTTELPRFEKKIIYLDQLVLSNIVKAKDPYWPELRMRLEWFIGGQLVCCPYSPLHDRESMLFHDLAEELEKLYKTLGGYDCLKPPIDIQRAQLARSLASFLGVGHDLQSRPP